jgi:hypothetical protein
LDEHSRKIQKWLESAWIKGCGVDENFRGDFLKKGGVVT